MTSLLFTWYASGWASFGLRMRYDLFPREVGLAAFLRGFAYGPLGLMFWMGYAVEQGKQAKAR